MSALIAVVPLGLCVMTRAVTLEDVPRHLGAIVRLTILFIMLSGIIAKLWLTMTLGQHLGVLALAIAIAFLLGTFRRAPRSARRR